MRAPFQILAIPYRIIDGSLRYCVFHRADHDQWQFIAGGDGDTLACIAGAIAEAFYGIPEALQEEVWRYIDDTLEEYYWEYADVLYGGNI